MVKVLVWYCVQSLAADVDLPILGGESTRQNVPMLSAQRVEGPLLSSLIAALLQRQFIYWPQECQHLTELASST